MFRDTVFPWRLRPRLLLIVMPLYILVNNNLLWYFLLPLSEVVFATIDLGPVCLLSLCYCNFQVIIIIKYVVFLPRFVIWGAIQVNISAGTFLWAFTQAARVCLAFNESFFFFLSHVTFLLVSVFPDVQCTPLFRLWIIQFHLPSRRLVMEQCKS